VSTPGQPGAIHDIGYRHYDGPRLGPAYVWRALFVHGLKGAYGLGRSARSKVMPMLLLGAMTVPALVIAAVVIVTGQDELPLPYPRYAVSFQLLVSVFVAAQAPQAVSRDLRFRVVALYFARPLGRRAYVEAKLLAMSLAVFLLVAVPLVVLYAGALLAELDFWEQSRGVLTGLAGAVVFAVVLSALGLLIAAVTPRRGLGVAAVIAVLVVLSGVSAVVQGIARDEGNEVAAGYAGLLSPFSLVDGVQVWALGAESSSIVGPPPGAGGPVFVAVVVAVVAACYALLVARFRRTTAL
jgi:ABC-2 type transport system permease protein